MMDLNKIVSYPSMTAQSVVAAKSCLSNALTLKLEQPRLPLFLVHIVTVCETILSVKNKLGSIELNGGFHDHNVKNKK